MVLDKSESVNYSLLDNVYSHCDKLFVGVTVIFSANNYLN